MDQHICKAKRQDNDEWVYGYYVMKQDTIFHSIQHHFILYQIPGESFVSWCPIKEQTLCRCSGIEDKNGNMIFEYDIVYKENEINGKVEWWQHRGWVITRNHKCDMSSDSSFYNVEVIGNIFDNTELMEG